MKKYDFRKGLFLISVFIFIIVSLISADENNKLPQSEQNKNNAVSAPKKKFDAELNLKGIITGATIGPLAIIDELKYKEISIYKVGDKIGNIQIKSILPQSILLSLNNEDISIKLEPKVGKEYKIIPIQQSIKQSDLDNYIDRITKQEKNKKQMMQNRTEIQWLISANEKFKGISLTEIPEKSLLYLMGLRKNDTILSINGEFFKNQKEAEKALLSIKSGSAIFLIERKGAYQEIKVSTK